MRRIKAKRRQLRVRLYRSLDDDFSELPAGELLVEHCSDHQLKHWKGRSETIQQYHNLWWYELAAQQANAGPQIIEALRNEQPIEQDLSTWGRAIRYKYSSSPLSAAGSMKWVGGRFNFGMEIDPVRYVPFPALYLAEDSETGIREMHGLSREDKRAGLSANELSLASKDGFAWVAISGKVFNLFDLTSWKSLAGITQILSKFKLSNRVRQFEDKYNLSAQSLIRDPEQLFTVLMSEDWRQFPVMFNSPANSQLLATWLAQAGFEGIKYVSTKTGKANLAVFTRQLEQSDSQVSVINPPLGASHCLLNRLTFSQAEKT